MSQAHFSAKSNELKKGASLVISALLCASLSPAALTGTAFADEADEQITTHDLTEDGEDPATGPVDSTQPEAVTGPDDDNVADASNDAPEETDSDTSEAADGTEGEEAGGASGLDAADGTDETETADAEAGASSTATANPSQDSPSAQAATSDASPVASAAQETAAEDEPAYPQWSYSGSTKFARYPAGLDTTVRKLIATIGEPARQIAADNDLYASAMIAQAILASDNGSSKIAKSPNFNLFGLQGNYHGESVMLSPQEAANDNTPGIRGAAYRKYPSYQASLEDYASLLTEKKPHFYQGARKSMTTSYEEACAHLQGRYSTEAGYAEALVDLIEEYDLARYDEPLDYELVNTYLMPAAMDESDDLEDGELAEKAAAGDATNVPGMEKRTLVDLVTEATRHLGEDYVWGGETCGAFDCSGLVSYAYRNALGVDIPRTTHYQCLEGEDVDFADLHAGDLVFFADSKGVCVHVGMYLGEGCYLEAPRTGDVVKVTTLEEKTPTFAKRLLATQSISRS